MSGLFEMAPDAVDLSSVTEGAISQEMAATTAAGAAALTGVLPMAPDADSVEFAAALNAAGGAYLATASEHAGQRTAFSGAQGLASATGVMTDALNAAASAF
ncbi:PE family protein [Mycobacterium sp. Aquia_216]|uniref:PE family protein n=1 Tax=Mycobacterium sp. Aquia_216 TaxID=2991729 RepID=UPI00227BA8F7|nr:PE family protein [Mycobacterium sp. Aquia_216]WAJ45258.1 PE family protein [Mycobacterium sp. Aquia_216]